MSLLVELILGLLNGTIEFAELTAIVSVILAFLGVVSLLGSVGLVLKFLVDLVKAIRGTPDKTIKRRFITPDGREGIEEIPYSPTMNMINATTHTIKELTDGRN